MPRPAAEGTRAQLLRQRLGENGCRFLAIGLDQRPESGEQGGMRERVELLGGTLTIDSADGQGTSIAALIPVGEPDAPTS